MARIWLGGATNNIYASGDWSPPGAVQPGDVLAMYSGTANMAGGDLAGDTLYVGSQTAYSTPAAVVVNLSHGAALTAVAATTSFVEQSIVFNATGVDTLHLAINANYYATMTTTVNIAPHSLLFGTVAVGGHNGALTMNGGTLSFFDNDGPSAVGQNCVALINTDVLGVGSFAVGAQSSLSFLHAVGPGQSVSLAGQDSLAIASPATFFGAVDVAQNAGSFTVQLAGIANADSYDYANNLLTLFSGKHVVDVLRFADSGSFQVSENTSGVFINAAGTALPPNTMTLPLQAHATV
jgi:hypothetical protein